MLRPIIPPYDEILWAEAATIGRIGPYNQAFVHGVDEPDSKVVYIILLEGGPVYQEDGGPSIQIILVTDGEMWYRGKIISDVLQKPPSEWVIIPHPEQNINPPPPAMINETIAAYNNGKMLDWTNYY